MKKLTFLSFLLVYYSCTSTSQQVANSVDTPIITDVPQEPAPVDLFVPPPKEKTVYYFGAVRYVYMRDMEYTYCKVETSRILTVNFRDNGKLSEDDKFMLLDDITSKILNPDAIEERKVYEFDSYSEASKKRQEVIKTKPYKTSTHD